MSKVRIDKNYEGLVFCIGHGYDTNTPGKGTKGEGRRKAIANSLKIKLIETITPQYCYNYMDHNVYLLATDPKNSCRDVIHSRDTSLKIRVFCMDNEGFTPDANEIQLYGYANSKLYAFETINIQAEDALDVVGAIQWYAGYIDFPEMEILPDDPRTGQEIAI